MEQGVGGVGHAGDDCASAGRSGEGEKCGGFVYRIIIYEYGVHLTTAVNVVGRKFAPCRYLLPTTGCNGGGL